MKGDQVENREGVRKAVTKIICYSCNKEWSEEAILVDAYCNYDLEVSYAFCSIKCLEPWLVAPQGSFPDFYAYHIVMNGEFLGVLSTLLKGWRTRDDRLRYCPKCAIHSYGPYCTKCGRELRGLAGGCPKCGAPRAVDHEYCHNCGNALPRH